MTSAARAESRSASIGRTWTVAENAQGLLDALRPLGGRTVRPGAGFGESPAGRSRFGHRQRRLGQGQTPTAGQPFADEPSVPGLAGLGRPIAQVDVAAVQGDHGLPQGLVTPEERNPGADLRLGPASSRFPQTRESTGLTGENGPRCRPPAGTLTPEFNVVYAKWTGPELNRRHLDFQSSALPTELPVQVVQQ